MIETKEVFVVSTNTDLTEGRGREFALAVCEIESTAIRMAKNQYVQGTDAPIHKTKVIKVNDKWYYPTDAVDVIPPTTADLSRQFLLDSKRDIIAKAKAAGLTDKDIEILMKK